MKLLLLSAVLLGAAASPVPRDIQNTTSMPATGWRDVTCDFGSLVKASNDPVQQWKDAQAATAYGEAADAWKGNGSQGDLSNFLADFFHARPDLDCKSVDNENCDVTVNCGQGGDANAAVNSPAGYMIINSIVELHRHIDAQYKGLLNALTIMNGIVGSYTSTFATQVDQLKTDQTLLAVTQFMLGVLSAGTFNSWLRGVPFYMVNSNTLGVTKDTTNAFTTATLNIVRTSQSAIDDLKVQNTMSAFLSQVVQGWADAIGNLTDSIFSDSEILYGLIANGKQWDTGASADALDLANSVQKTLFAYITPMAWKMAEPEIGAFIATSEGIHHKEDKCMAYDPWDTFKHSHDYHTDADALPPAHFCDDDGKAYFLLRMERASYPKNTIATQLGTRPTVTSVSGIDTLDGKHWGGLTVFDLGISAVKSWKANGQKNGWKAADLSTTEGFDDIFNNGINATGVVNIPVCSFDEAWGNAYQDIETDNWPCN